MNDRLLSPSEAARKLTVPVSWVYERTRHNAMPGLVRIGKYVRIREADLKEFINSGGELNQR